MRRIVQGVITVLILLSLRLGTPGAPVFTNLAAEPKIRYMASESDDEPAESPVVIFENENLIADEPPEALVEYARDIFLRGNSDLPENVLFFLAKRPGRTQSVRKYRRQPVLLRKNRIASKDGSPAF